MNDGLAGSRLRRETMALLAAFVLHAAAFWSVSRPAASQGASGELEPVDLDIEPARMPTEALRPAAVEPERAPVARSFGVAARVQVPSQSAEPVGPAEVPPAPSSGAVFDLVPPTRLSLDQLGLAGRNMFLAGSPDKSSRGPPAPAPERNEAPGVDVSMHDALVEHDHAAGMDSAGAVVGIAEDVARQGEAPLNSRAVFELTVDAKGEVTSVQVVDASAAQGVWERIAASLVSSLRARRPAIRRGPPMVVTLEITSRWQLPSGDSPGSPVHAEQGGISFDVTDIGARPLRVVHARIVREKAQR